MTNKNLYQSYLNLSQMAVTLGNFRHMAAEFKAIGGRNDNPNMATAAKQIELGIDGVLAEIDILSTDALERSGVRRITVTDGSRPKLTLLKGGGLDDTPRRTTQD